jgi:hypothetical protein
MPTDASLLEIEGGQAAALHRSPSHKNELAANQNLLELDGCKFCFDKLPD